MEDVEEEFRQAALKGVWRNKDGCPHRCNGTVDLCEEMEMSPCLYETGSGPCETFQEVLEEWRIDYEICSECFQTRPGDERIAAGMKCGVCAGYGSYQEFEDAGVTPGDFDNVEALG